MGSSLRSLLDPTGNVVAERAVIDDAPRPGSWFGDDGADGRFLTQEQTDLLIRSELRSMVSGDASSSILEELSGILGDDHPVELSHEGRRGRPVSKQRGGVDSDPLVRLLAFRVWGDRDRRWFELRGVQEGERVVRLAGGPGGGQARSEIALQWCNEPVIGVVRRDAPPGANVEVDVDEKQIGFQLGSKPERRTMRVSGRLRVEPVLALPDRREDDEVGVTPRRTAYRFDQLQLEHDFEHGHGMVVAAAGAYRAKMRVGESTGVRGTAAFWRQCKTVLAEELRQLGATLGSFY